MKRKLLWIGLAVLLLAVLGGFAASRRGPRPAEVQTAKAGREDLQAKVSANGKIQAQKKVDVSATIPGQITRLAVEEGDRVEKGQFLLQIDAVNPRAAARSNEFSMQALREELESSRACRRGGGCGGRGAGGAPGLAPHGFPRPRPVRRHHRGKPAAGVAPDFGRGLPAEHSDRFGVAGIGGIVIMNIMLVSVAERTAEIGLRRALGARQRDVRRQFLLEAARLSLVGGAAGVLAGSLLALAVDRIAHFPANVTPGTALLGLALFVLVGIAAGYGPAVHASRLLPVDALRAE